MAAVWADLSTTKRRPIRLAVLPIIALGLVGFAPATTHTSARPCVRVTASQFREFSAAVWAPQHWRRGSPSTRAIHGQRRKLKCAGGHLKTFERTWRTDKRQFYKHRHGMLWLGKFKPFVYPDGTRWAVPWPIAACESGENYYVGPSGAYGLIPPLPQDLPPKKQDELAHRLYEQMGEGPWASYESGCAYR